MDSGRPLDSHELGSAPPPNEFRNRFGHPDCSAPPKAGIGTPHAEQTLASLDVSKNKPASKSVCRTT